MAIRSWEDYYETVALMSPGDVAVDPLERRERCGEPVELDLADDAHGTTAGYWRHRRIGEAPCDGCRLAQNAHRTALRHAKRETAVP